MEGTHDKVMHMQQSEIVKRHEVLAGNIPMCLDDNEDDPVEKGQVGVMSPSRRAGGQAAAPERRGNKVRGMWPWGEWSGGLFAMFSPFLSEPRRRLVC